MNLSHKEQYLNMSTESALRAVSSRGSAQREYSNLNQSGGQKHYDDAKVHEAECLHFKQQAGECSE